MDEKGFPGQRKMGEVLENRNGKREMGLEFQKKQHVQRPEGKRYQGTFGKLKAVLASVGWHTGTALSL